MEHENFPRKSLIIISIASVFVLFGTAAYSWARFNEGKLHVVFCDVGQGDAIFVRTPKGNDILVDGGPGESVLSCLANHMPFWDRDIELMLLSHPHEDHLAGLISVLERYTVKHFATERLTNSTAGFSALQDAVEGEPLKTQYMLAGDSIKTNDDVAIQVLGPSKSYVEKKSPRGTIGEKEEFASLVLLVSYGEFDILLTGDSQAEGIESAIQNRGSTPTIEVLQVPHHGSKTGLTSELVQKLSPKLAVISVGKNRYGHPNKGIIDLLRDRKIQIKRTDEDGKIEIVSDGTMFSLQK